MRSGGLRVLTRLSICSLILALGSSFPRFPHNLFAFPIPKSAKVETSSERASEPRSLCVCYVHARCVLCAFHERAMCVLCACYVRATCACYMCVLCARSSDRPPDRSPVRPSVPPTVLGWTVAHTLRVSKLSQLEKHLIVSWRVV